MYPGALPTVRANLFNIILVLDLSHTSSLNFISGTVSNLLSRDLPLRFGVVPQVETADGMSLSHPISSNAKITKNFQLRR